MQHVVFCSRMTHKLIIKRTVWLPNVVYMHTDIPLPYEDAMALLGAHAVLEPFNEIHSEKAAM